MVKLCNYNPTFNKTRVTKMVEFTKEQWREESSEAVASGVEPMGYEQWVSYRTLLWEIAKQMGK